MTPIEFKEQNVVFAKDQPEYLPLPAFVQEDGTVISCWEMTDEEANQFFKTRKLYITMLTFGQPLQPILPSIESPFEGT